MTMNALSNCAEEHGGFAPADYDAWLKGPPKALVAAIPYDTVKGAYNLGKLGLRDVVAWLDEDGLKMPGTPDGNKRGQVTQARLDAAVTLLQRHGYTVLGPNVRAKPALPAQEQR
jgi:hypothetical protein